MTRNLTTPDALVPFVPAMADEASLAVADIFAGQLLHATDLPELIINVPSNDITEARSAIEGVALALSRHEKTDKVHVQGSPLHRAQAMLQVANFITQDVAPLEWRPRQRTLRKAYLDLVATHQFGLVLFRYWQIKPPLVK